MQFSIAAQLKQPGLVGHYEADVHLPAQSYMGRTVAFHGPLHVEARYVYDGESLLVQGTVKTILDSVCALCTKEFQEPFSFDFEERFVKDPDPEDECYPMGSEALDLTQAVLDNLFLNLPLQSLCKEDCKGVCQFCGANLNEGQCSCKKPVDPRLEALKQLLDN